MTRAPALNRLAVSQPSGEPTQDLLVLASEPVRGAVRTALQRSVSSNASVRALGGWIGDGEGPRRRVVVTVSPLEFDGTSELSVKYLARLSYVGAF